ncbi:hypothetical protein ACSSS7_002506 [Eimeria intestinalis]
MAPTARAVTGIRLGVKRPRSLPCAESFSGCCWGPRLLWLLRVFKVLCFCWIFRAKPSCAVVIKRPHRPTSSPSATTWPLNQCLHTPRQCPRQPSESSYPEPLAATTPPLTIHSLQCTTTMPEASPQQADACTAATAAVAPRRLSSTLRACGRSRFFPFPSSRSGKPLAFCRPSSEVPCCSDRSCLLTNSCVQQLRSRPHDGSGDGGLKMKHMGSRRWRGGTSLVRCLDSLKGSDLSGIPSYLKVSAEEVRSVAASLAFWLRPRAMETVKGAPDTEELRLISSTSEDLAFAWVALSEVGDTHAAVSQTPSPEGPALLPLAALREDVPRLFWQPSENSNDSLHLPPWNPEACECQQSISAAEEGAPPLPARTGPPGSQAPPPFFFGRYLAISGFSPSSGPQASSNS